MKKTLIGYIILALACISCSTREPFLETRAKQQLPVSIEHDLNNFEAKEIQDLQTVYVNDSICMLQCRLKITDKSGKTDYMDLRYTYLIDFMESHFKGKAIYKENFEFITRLPDEYIKKSKQEVRKRKESVYKYMYGGTYPIAHPFDEN